MNAITQSRFRSISQPCDLFMPVIAHPCTSMQLVRGGGKKARGKDEGKNTLFFFLHLSISSSFVLSSSCLEISYDRFRFRKGIQMWGRGGEEQGVFLL